MMRSAKGSAPPAATSSAAASAAASSVAAALSTPATAAAAASSVAARPTPARSAAAAAAVTPASDAYDFGPFRPGQVAATLLHYFEHRALRDTQARAISAILRGKDTFVLAPTGGGKSLCYMLPALLHAQAEPGRVVVVVSPLIALMEDQVSYLKSRGIRAAMLGSTVSAADKRTVFADLNAPLASATAAAAAAAAAAPVAEDNCISVEDEERQERWAAKQAPIFRPAPKPVAAAAPAAPAQRLSLLFVSPELLSGSSGQEILSSLVSAGRVPFVAIDEVHCMSSWGHNFRPAFLRLAFLKRSHPAVPLMLLTATATSAVQKDVLSILGLQRGAVEMVRQSFNRANVCYEVVNKEMIATLSNQSIYAHLKSEILKALGVNAKAEQQGEEKDGATMEMDETEAAAAAAMSAAAPVSAPRPAAPAPVGQGSVIIYCSTRDSCATVAAELRKLSLSAAAYHAGLSTSERTSVQQAWMAGRTQIVAATNAFGMGINKADVRAVVHFGLTCSSLEAYYQESGRCGRDGQPALALVYYSQDEMRRQQYLAKLDNQQAPEDGSGAGGETKKVFRPGGSAGTVEHRLALLEEMVRYCEASTCRRQVLLQYFGEMLANSTPSLVAARRAGKCCDVCAAPEKVQQSLKLAKTLGVRGAGTASMAPLKSGFVFAGKKTGQDEYDYDDSAEPAEGGDADGSALSHKRKRADPEDEESESRVAIPKHILMDKSSNSLHGLMNHLEAAEARSNRAQGIDRSVKRVPFASLKTPASAAAATKRRGPAYKGALLGVDGAHSIKDLPLSKREQCFARLTPAVATNAPFSSAATSSSCSAAHPPERIAAALEYQAWSASHSSAGYLASMRTLLHNLATATKNAQELAEIRTINWEKIPLRVEDSSSSSDSEDDGSDRSSSDDDDAASAKAKAARTTAATGEFISAASLVAKPAAPSSLPSRSKPGGLGFAPASSLAPGGTTIAAAGIAGAKRSNPAAASPASVARAMSSNANMHTLQSTGEGVFKKPTGVQAPFKKPGAATLPAVASTSASSSASSAATTAAAGSSAASKLSSFFTASSSSTRPALPLAPSPPRSSSNAPSNGGSGQKFKFGTTLQLSWAHPVGSAKTSVGGAATSKAVTGSSAAAPQPPSPSRIQPLTITSAGTPPKLAAATAAAEDRSAKRPRLDLTTSP